MYKVGGAEAWRPAQSVLQRKKAMDFFEILKKTGIMRINMRKPLVISVRPLVFVLVLLIFCGSTFAAEKLTRIAPNVQMKYLKKL